MAHPSCPDPQARLAPLKTGRERAAPRPSGPLARFALAAAAIYLAIGCAGALAADRVPPMGPFLAVAIFTGCVLLAGRGILRGYPHDRLGACNVITLIRASIVAGLSMPLAAPLAAPGLATPGLAERDPGLALAMMGLAAFALLLDGLDGHLARRSGLVSDFGARFDMEVDCLFALLLALLALQDGKAGAWILLVGGVRYLFVAAGALLPWLRAPLPDRRSRKVVCVVQIAVLVVLLAPPVTPAIAAPLAAAALGALLWSFGRDVLWLAARR